MKKPLTVYGALGPDTFFRLVDAFYDRVETDPLLHPMYPADVTESRRHLALFLIQYYGGPTTYSDERGHPRLRARHAAFTIDKATRDAWIGNMRAAVESLGLPSAAGAELIRYFEGAADFLINH
ncbi:MAG TPA: globin [Chloroflexota bacterium]|nr:globin [Chloroflexota bacterium]